MAAAAVACGEDAISSGPLKAKKDTLTLRGEGAEGRPTDRADLGEGKFPAHSLFLGGELNLFLASSRKHRHTFTPLRETYSVFESFEDNAA